MTWLTMTDAQRIERLMVIVERSDVVFIRNGAEYRGADAGAHLRRKLSAAGGAEKLTLEQFLTQVAARSSTSGTEYQIRTSDGALTTAELWLRAQAVREHQSAYRTDTQDNIDVDDADEPPIAPRAATRSLESESREAGGTRAWATPADVLAFIRSADIEFQIRERDGEIERHSARSTARRIEWKYRLAGRPALDVERFISEFCTMSTTHGAPYEALTPAGARPLAAWLRGQAQMPK